MNIPVVIQKYTPFETILRQRYIFHHHTCKKKKYLFGVKKKQGDHMSKKTDTTDILSWNAQEAIYRIKNGGHFTSGRESVVYSFRSGIALRATGNR